MCLSLSPKLTSTLAAYVASCTRWHSEKLISLIAECLPSFKMGPLLGSYMWTFFGNYFWDREYAELIELIECFSFWAHGEREILQVYFTPKVLSAVSLIVIIMKEHFLNIKIKNASQWLVIANIYTAFKFLTDLSS